MLNLDFSVTVLLKNECQYKYVPARFVSRYRVVVSNLPANVDDARLRRVCVAAAPAAATVTEARVMRDLRALVGRDGKHP